MQTADGTVLGVASLRKTLPLVAAVLVVLFTVIRPEASLGLSFIQRALYWLIHIGAGLGGVLLASRLIRSPALSRLPAFAAIAVSGLLGAAVAAPVYWAVEAAMPIQATEMADDWLDVLAAKGTLAAVVAEYLEAAPVLVAAWFAINIPLLFNARSGAAPSPGDGPDPPPAPRKKISHDQVWGDNEVLNRLFASLPDVIGKDLVAVSSDLHYLHVHTALGKAVILGSLRDVAAALNDAGTSVHRAHWVRICNSRSVSVFW